MAVEELDKFFNPKSVAIIGASRHPTKIGHVILRNFVEGGFQGKIIPVNPKADSILGLKCYRSIKDAPVTPDLAVVVVPAPIVPQVMEEIGEAGTKACIIISGGFSEVGNVELEEKVKRIAKEHGIRVIGPNCVGVYDSFSKVDTVFMPKYRMRRPDRGGISFISQSGALGTAVLDWAANRGFGMSKFISYGNAIDVDEVDLLNYLAEDRSTSVIALYIEGVRRGREFMELAKEVTRRKPVVVLKGGVGRYAQKAVSSHTGSLAGSFEVYKAMFKQTGIIGAATLEELFDFARTLDFQPCPQGKRVVIITNGGGMGVLTVDAVERYGLELADLSEESKERIREKVPPYAVVSNPIDLVGDADEERYRVALEAAMEDENVDMIAVIVLFQTSRVRSEIVDVITGFSQLKKKPIVVISAGGEFTEVHRRMLETSGVPTFSTPRAAIKALRALYDYGVWLRKVG